MAMRAAAAAGAGAAAGGGGRVRQASLFTRASSDNGSTRAASSPSHHGTVRFRSLAKQQLAPPSRVAESAQCVAQCVRKSREAAEDGASRRKVGSAEEARARRHRALPSHRQQQQAAAAAAATPATPPPPPPPPPQHLATRASPLSRSGCARPGESGAALAPAGSDVESAAGDMSASVVAARSAAALSVSNMDEELEPRQQSCEELAEEPERRPSLEVEPQVDAQLRAMAVSATTRTLPTGSRTDAATRAHHDTVPSTTTSTGTRSAGESLDDVNGKDRPKLFIRTCQRFESGSGSGDQDGMVSMEDGTDVAAKKRKTRRGKPKHRKLKPYSKQQPSYQQRLRCRASGRPSKAGRSNNPLAPNNTNQFLMEDHNELPDLDEKIAAGAAAPANPAGDPDFSKPYPPPARTRDSSFSVDSDEDFYYSSPEDEEEFLSKEFSSVYEETHAERLSGLSKAQLIDEYIQLESKVDSLAKRLRAKNSSAAAAAAASGPSEPARDAELAKKLKAVQQRVEELQQQNERLRRENEMLRQRRGSPMSSVDSESDSDSSSSRSHADSDCSDCQHKASQGSSPVPASYHACRDKAAGRRKSSSVSSVASETESSSATNDSSCPGPAAGSPAKSPAAANGHAGALGLPT